MNEENINNLREALKLSPNNIPLRMLLADSLFQANRLDEAETEYTLLVKNTNEIKAKVGLAKVYYAKENYSACNVILEEAIDSGHHDLDALIMYAKGMLKEDNVERALEIYQNILTENPGFIDEDLDSQLRVRSSASEDDSENLDDFDLRFLQKPTINFGNVGGMEAVKKEIDLKIIRPILHPELYQAYGKKIGGGILLYGPPGCGKTYIAKATAGQINAKFINVGLNDILDMWIGSSEKNLHEIFELARRNTPCVLFIDEIDALGASRSDMKQSAGRQVINQFLQELDGINSNNEGVLVLGATNTPWNLDPAFRRPGRFDRIVFVPPPDPDTREAILKLKLQDKPVESVDYGKIAKNSKHFSGADIDAIIDIAIELKLEESFKDGIPKPLNTKDFIKALKKHKPSTQEWFATAKNFAMFSNESGLYDDILDYLNIKK